MPRWPQHRVRWHWVKGHDGHVLNERADQLARDGLQEVRASAGAKRPAASAGD